MKYDVTVGGRTFDIHVDGEGVTIAGRRVSGRLVAIPGTPLVRLSVGGVSRTYAMTRVAGGWKIQHDGRVWMVDTVDERSRSLRRLLGSPELRQDDGIVRAPMPGLVVRLEVEEGQRVAAGAGLLVLEAMKMENEIRSVSGGTVKRILVRSGQVVEKGSDLVEIQQG